MRYRPYFLIKLSVSATQSNDDLLQLVKFNHQIGRLTIVIDFPDWWCHAVQKVQTDLVWLFLLG